MAYPQYEDVERAQCRVCRHYFNATKQPGTAKDFRMQKHDNPAKTGVPCEGSGVNPQILATDEDTPVDNEPNFGDERILRAG